MPESSDGSLVDDTEWANTPHGAYESAVLEVVRQVDEHFPTIDDRSARAIAGLSMGGYGALNIGLHHLSTFGTIESWSGYFHQDAHRRLRRRHPGGPPLQQPGCVRADDRSGASQPATARVPLRGRVRTG